MVKTILFFLVILVILFTSGIWITTILLPQKYKEHKFVVSFVLGLFWLIIVSAWASYLGFAFKQSAAFILIFSEIMSVIAVFIEIKRNNLRDWIPSKWQLIVTLLGVISGVLVLLPSILFNVPFTYGDGFTYISIADYLSGHGYFQPANPNPYFPWLTQMKLYQDGGLRMGAQFFLSFVSSVFMRKFSIDVFMPSVAAGEFCFILAIWLFCKIGLEVPTKASLVAAIFAAVHLSIPIKNAITGFFPQAYGIVMLLLIFSLILKIEDWNEGRFPYIVLTSISLTALIMTYSELLPFVVLSTCFVCIVKIIKNKRDYLGIIVNLCCVALLATLLSNIALVKALKAIMVQMNVVVGGNIPYSLWNYIMIFFSLSPFYPSSGIAMQYPIVYLAGNLAVMMAIYIILESFLFSQRWKDHKLKLLLLGSSFILVLLFSIFIAKNPWVPGERGQTWNIFKTSTYAFAFFPAIIGMSYYDLTAKSRYKKYIGVFLLSGYVSLALVFNFLYASDSSNLMKQYTGNQVNPLGEYYRIYYEYKDVKKPINLICPLDLIKHKQMLAYFLRDHEIITDWSDDDGYIMYYLLPQNVSPPMNPKGITLAYNPNAAGKIANMELMKKQVYMNFISGVYDLEHDAVNTWRWSAGNATLRAINPSGVKEEVRLQLGIGLAANDSKKTIEVWQNNQKVTELVIIPNQINNINLSLTVNPGKSEILFKYLGNPIKAGSDPRELAFLIQNFKYSEK